MPSDDAGRPLVWLLMGHRAGDNEQVLALAEALGWPFETRHFVYRPCEFLTNRLLGATLAGIDRARSSALGPPWPDLVISAGRRNEPVARWIRARAGKPVRLVHLGRPWADPRRFDLVVTTPQYRVPALPGVMEIEAPLHRVSPARLAAAAARWQPLFEPLPRPRIAVLVGGDSPPYRFDTVLARELAGKASALARRRGGSVLVTTSKRTRREAAAALRQAIDVPCYFYDWTPEADSNPYLGILAAADAIVVTGETMSMLAEACATGKPVYIFDLGRGWTAMRPGPAGRPAPPLAERLRPRAVAHWTTAHLLPARVRRDVRVILRRFVASGRAAWLGDDAPPAAAPVAADDLARVVRRVRELVGTGPAG
ncbi:MAG: mitochondrial fission ELM1 family protein [Rhodospirillaceae bacterium]|nr:mitochondrial fission ELM1 family protein [Rhodospirillaceae bacterium]